MEQIYSVAVSPLGDYPIDSSTIPNSISIPNSTTLGWTDPYTGTGTYYWSVTNPIYMYQIKCPKRTCKKMNWMQLNTITPCKGCGAKLKAVSEQADFEISVE